MQTTQRPNVHLDRTWATAAFGLLAAILLGGCSSGATGWVAVPDPVGTGPLLTVESRGGECMEGPCGSTVVIERDGKMRSADEPAQDLGTLAPDRLAALDAAIKTTDFAVLMNRPFTGECPTAYDGQEFIFEFGAPNGPQRIATCEVEVDYESPVFAAVGAALAEVMPLPLP